jgi:hypothetical protein
MMEGIVNKVAESGLVTLDLQDYLPKEEQLAVFDLKDYLFMGLILKEKDFRTALQGLDWTTYTDKAVALCCTADAIIPAWAYMLVATYLEPVATTVFMGTKEELRKHLLLHNIAALPGEAYVDKRMVIKGCGEAFIPSDAYMAITLKLRPVARSIMYGEPCSTVPVFKKR